MFQNFNIVKCYLNKAIVSSINIIILEDQFRFKFNLLTSLLYFLFSPFPFIELSKRQYWLIKAENNFHFAKLLSFYSLLHNLYI